MLLCLILVTVQGISFPLQGKGNVKCFNQIVEAGKEMVGAFVVSGEKDQNVLTTFLNSEGVVLYTSQPLSREGKFDMKAEKTMFYKLCFQSKDKTEKTISFEFYIQDGMQEEKVATQEEFGPLRTSFRRASRSLDTVYRNIQFYERRERAHRDLAEITCDRVVFSTVLKMVVLALISVAQVWMLRSFFNNKRGVTI